MSESTNKAGDQLSLHPDFTLSPSAQTGQESMDTEGQVEEESSEPSMTWLLLRELVETVVLSLVIFLLIRQVVQNYRIESHSMEPNFYEGQFILVNKLAYRLGSPSRGDVIVFHNPNNTEEDYIKRVIGLPGDTLEISGQTVFVNGDVLQEPYHRNQLSPGSSFGPVVIDPNHLFVMGDNRPNSSDSRRFGQLDQDLVVGKSWIRVWPLSDFGPVQHYDVDPGVPVSASSEP